MRASARLGNQLLQPPLRGQRAESDDRPRPLGGRFVRRRECTAIDVSIADMGLCTAPRCAPPAYGARRRGSEAPAGCADRRCGGRCEALQQSLSMKDADRPGAGNRAARETAGLFAEPRDRRLRDSPAGRRSLGKPAVFFKAKPTPRDICGTLRATSSGMTIMPYPGSWPVFCGFPRVLCALMSVSI